MENLLDIIGNKTVGVIGVGKWGSQLVSTLEKHSKHAILQSDPVRAKKEPDFAHVSLDEIIERAEIVIIASPQDAIRGILLEVRGKLRQGQIIIDIASSKRSFADVQQNIDDDGRAIVGSIHPMSSPPPNPPSLRGQNGIICHISDRLQEAETFAKALFETMEMTIETMRVAEHDRLMDVIQGLPHVFQLGALATLGNTLPDGRTIQNVEKFQSPNFELTLLSIGRTASAVDANLQASLIMGLLASPAGERILEQSIASMQRIVELGKHDRDLPTTERLLPAFIEATRKKIDPDGSWRERMRVKTNVIIQRLGNIRKKSLTLIANKDHIGLLKQICTILERHDIDLNAIDSLQSKKPDSVEFELGRKDGTPMDWDALEKDLERIEVVLKKAETQQ